MIPAVVIGLTARAGFSKFLPPASPAVENLLLKRSPIGLNALEAGTSGLLTGSLLRPSAQDPSQDLNGFLIDRAKGGLAGAASFTALTGINALSVKLGAKADSTLARGALTNPISNVLLSGASAGLLNAELNSFARTGRPTADLNAIGKSVLRDVTDRRGIVADRFHIFSAGRTHEPRATVESRTSVTSCSRGR